MIDYENYIKDLSSLVSVDSVRGEKEVGAPFGAGVKTALCTFLSIAQGFGFETVNYDGYGGEVIFGKGEEIGIIGHLDVVPVGTGWNYPPFSLTRKDGYLIGRGVADDKGATLLALYALKALKDSAAPCNKKFRLIVGCAEETDWADVAYIKTKTALPEFGFSPDGNFPVSYAEKGIYFVKTLIPPFKNFSPIVGGTVVNAVCALAKTKPAGVPDPALIKKHGLEYKDGYIVSTGVSAHGSLPHLGKNALLPLLNFLKDSGENVGEYIEYLFGDKWNILTMSNPQGKVTLSPDLAKPVDGGTEITCDCRIPAPFTVKDVSERLFTAPFKVNVIDHAHPPFMIEKNSPLVKALLSAYNEVTGENSAPVSMGGSTFARVFEKGCAFGPEFPNVNYHMHEADERVREEDLKKCAEIYERAIFNLAALKENL